MAAETKTTSEVLHEGGGHEAFPPKLVERFKRLRVDAPAPVTTAFRSGTIEIVETVDEYRARYPEIYAQAFHEAYGQQLIGLR